MSKSKRITKQKNNTSFWSLLFPPKREKTPLEKRLEALSYLGDLKKEALYDYATNVIGSKANYRPVFLDNVIKAVNLRMKLDKEKTKYHGSEIVEAALRFLEYRSLNHYWHYYELYPRQITLAFALLDCHQLCFFREPESNYQSFYQLILDNVIRFPVSWNAFTQISMFRWYGDLYTETKIKQGEDLHLRNSKFPSIVKWFIQHYLPEESEA